MSAEPARAANRPIRSEDLEVAPAVRRDVVGDQAVVAEFLDRLGAAVDERVDARVAARVPPAPPPNPGRPPSVAPGIVSVLSAIAITSTELGVTRGRRPVSWW